MANIDQTPSTTLSPNAMLLDRVPALRTASTQAKAILRQPAVRRAAPMLMFVTVAALGLFAWLFLTEPPRMPISSGATEAEKAQIADMLTASGVQHWIDEVTGQIEVQRDDFHRARMLLAANGITQAPADGYSMLGDLPMGTSRAVEQTRLRQAQELELARSITEIGIVQGARVHLALPERTAFLRDSQPPRASVFLQVTPGRVLDAVQVQAIVNLVASSVPGLAREAVSVVDQSGRLLSSGVDSPGSLLDDRDLQHRLRVEDMYRQRVESVLLPLTGAGNLAVQVTMEMDFTRAERTEERVDPNGVAIRSEQLSRDESGSMAARGIPGAVSNTPPDEAQLTEEASAASNGTERVNLSTNETRNYEISRSVQTTVFPGARIARVHAAVLVDAPIGEDGTVTPPANEADIRRLVESAIGFDESRGDTVSLSFQPFVQDDTLIQSSWADAPWWPDLARQGVTLVLVALIVFGVVRPLLSRALNPASQMADPLGVAPQDDGLVEVREGESLTALRRRLEPGAASMGAASTGYSYEEKVALARQLVTEDNDRVAAVFGAMIRDELDVVN